ncbi:hypothetical protein [Thiolapillus sp.]
MNKNKLLLIAGALAGIFILSSNSHARSYYDPDRNYSRSEAKHACKDEIREKIWADHRYIQKVEFTRGSISMWRETYSKTGVRGKGRFLNRKDRWRPFDFTCVYSPEQERVVSASYRKTSSDWNNSNRPDYNDGRHACRQEIDRKILRKHDSAIRIHWNDRTVRKNYEGNSRVSYAGSGQFKGGRGRTRHFEFRCTYDQRRDDVVNARVDIDRR